MNESGDQIINSKLEELHTYLKIDTYENSWRDDLIRELKSTNINYKIYRIIGLIFMIGSAIMAFIALLVEGETILGSKIKEHVLMAFFMINLISLIFILVGKLELKKDRIKTFLLLHDLNT